MNNTQLTYGFTGKQTFIFPDSKLGIKFKSKYRIWQIERKKIYRKKKYLIEVYWIILSNDDTLWFIIIFKGR